VLRSRRGATALEFALVAFPFLILVIGIIEISWQLTAAAALDRGVLIASRFGTTGGATRPGEPPTITCRSQTIPWLITNATGGLLNPARLTVSTASYGNVSGLSGGVPVAGAGSGGQVVTYVITYEQPYLTGAWLHFVGGSASIVHQATIVVKNEPFDNGTC
jgi:Flp pilus assembly protein TadG